jgi:hypothetical protein
MYTPKIMICENHLRKTGVILKMGKKIKNKRIKTVLKICLKNRNHWFSQKSKNRPTLVWTWIHSQGSPEQSVLDALSMVR